MVAVLWSPRCETGTVFVIQKYVCNASNEYQEDKGPEDIDGDSMQREIALSECSLEANQNAKEIETVKYSG